jgi:purine-binding chemotaxis protein CheW
MIESLLTIDAEGASMASYLTFDLGPDIFAVRVDVVREVLDVRLMKPATNQRAKIAGTIDLHGQLLAVFDLSRRDRAGDPAALVSGPCVVVLGVDGLDGYMIGVLVDRVRDVVDVRLDRVSPVFDPPIGWSEAALYGVVCLEGRRIHLLNLPRPIDRNGQMRLLH